MDKLRDREFVSWGSFGKILREKREQEGISISKLAKLVGLSSSYLARIERGDSKSPPENRIETMAEVLNMDKDYLLACGGRIAFDLVDIIIRSPKKMAKLIRDNDKKEV
jgi:transcriptional regulator with XRE-family HTH domain